MNNFFTEFEKDMKKFGIKGRFIAGTCDSPYQLSIDFLDLLVYYAGRILFFRVHANKKPISMSNDFTDEFLDGEYFDVYSVSDIKNILAEKAKDPVYFNQKAVIKELNAVGVNERKERASRVLFGVTWANMFEKLVQKESVKELLKMISVFNIIPKISAKQNNVLVTFYFYADEIEYLLNTFSLAFWPTSGDDFYIQADKVQYIEETLSKSLESLLNGKEFNDWLILHGE